MYQDYMEKDLSDVKERIFRLNSVLLKAGLSREERKEYREELKWLLKEIKDAEGERSGK